MSDRASLPLLPLDHDIFVGYVRIYIKHKYTKIVIYMYTYVYTFNIEDWEGKT